MSKIKKYKKLLTAISIILLTFSQFLFGQQLKMMPIKDLQSEIENSKQDDPLTTEKLKDSQIKEKSLTTSQILELFYKISSVSNSESDYETMIRLLSLNTLDEDYFKNKKITSYEEFINYLTSNILTINYDMGYDRILIRFLYVKKLNLESSSQILFEDSNLSVMTKDYFQHRINLQLNRYRINYGVDFDYETNILNSFAELALLFEDNLWIYSEFKNIIENVNFKGLTTSGLRLIKYIYSSKMRELNPTLSTIEQDSLFELAFNLASKVSFLIKVQQSDLEWLNQFNQYIDRLVVQQNSFQNAVLILDQRQKINQTFQELLSKRLQNANQQDINTLSSFTISHPIFDIYFKTALAKASHNNDSTKFIINQRTQVSNSTDLNNFLIEQMGQLKNISNINLDNYDPNSFLTYFTQRSEMDLIKHYFSGFSQVEFARYYFSFSSNSNTEKLRNEYKKARLLLQTTLCFRFSSTYEKLFDSCDIIGNLKGNNYYTPTKAQPLIPNFDTTELIQNLSVLKFTMKGKTQIPAGIYYTTNNIEIHADEVTFHPLSMIYTYGSDFKISANEISNLWLDVSGGDQLQFSLAPPVGTPANSNGQVGLPPVKPIPGSNGGHSGNIIINSGLNNSLLIAIGGNGQNGFEGGPSPQCNGGQYYTVIHSWTTYVSKPKDCGWCYVKLCLYCPKINRCHSDGDRRQACGSYNIPTNHSVNLDTASGPGGDGGNAGNGGVISVKESSFSRQNRFLFFSGIAGVGGKQGSCGNSPESAPGQNGNPGSLGKLNFL